MAEYKDYVRLLLNMPVLIDIVVPIPVIRFWLKIDNGAYTYMELPLTLHIENELQRKARRARSAAAKLETVETRDIGKKPAPPPAQSDDKLCVVCMEKPVDCVLYRCGHNGTVCLVIY